MTTTFLRMRRLLLDGAGGDGIANPAFSMVEFLLAAILITIVVSGTTVSLLVSNRSARPSENVDELERLIAQDLALIRELNDRFTCCGLECSDAAIASGAAGPCGPVAKAAGEAKAEGAASDGTPLPAAAHPFNGAIAAATNPDVCLDGRVAERMIAAFPDPPTAPPGVSLTRTGPTVADPVANRLQWTYTASVDGVTMISRVVNLVPNAAESCR